MRELADVLEREAEQAPPAPSPAPADGKLPWAALLWVVPPETRLGVRELAEALNRPKSWVYDHTRKAGTCPRIPHRRIDGSLTFIVGEVRRWLGEHEVIEVPGHLEPLTATRPRRAG